MLNKSNESKLSFFNSRAYTPTYTHAQGARLYSSTKASVSYEAEKEAVLQGTLYVPIRLTSKGTCSSTVAEIEQSIIQGCRDQQ